MRERGNAKVLLLIVVAAVIVGAQGCQLFKAKPTPPASRLTPTIVGVVADVEFTSTAMIWNLTDGRTVVEELQAGGGPPTPGNLLLAQTTAPKIIAVLRPIGEGHPGCWDAEGLAMAVWDEDGSLLVGGVELPKAPGFHDDAISEVIDGRKVWTREANVVWSICVNVTGQVEWISSPYKANLSHT